MSVGEGVCVGSTGVRVFAGVGSGVAVVVGVSVGVREAEGVESPSTCSPLFNTTNDLFKVIKFPFSSVTEMLNW
jgi:hypothetical protein